MEGRGGAEEDLRSCFRVFFGARREKIKKNEIEGEEGGKEKRGSAFSQPKCHFFLAFSSQNNHSSLSKSLPLRFQPLSTPFFPPISRHEVRADSSIRRRALAMCIADQAIEKRG